MDKQMVSHYGWIIVTTLITTVMLLLATPFGHYVGTGMINTTDGFIDVSDEVLSDENMENKEEGWENKFTELYSKPDVHKDIIPTGGTYYIGVTSTDIKSTAGYTEKLISGQQFPTPQTGDVYQYGHYLYRYNCIKEQNPDGTFFWKEQNINGWALTTINKRNTYYSPLASINNKKVVSARYSFHKNYQLKTSPVLPDSITDMYGAFSYCHELKTILNIPQKTVDLSYAFSDCYRLTSVSEIPLTVTKMDRTFYNCSDLETSPSIPNEVISLNSTYAKSGITSAPIIPEKVKDVQQCFSRCRKLFGDVIINTNVIENYDKMFDSSAKSSNPDTFIYIKGNIPNSLKSAIGKTGYNGGQYIYYVTNDGKTLNSKTN